VQILLDAGSLELWRFSGAKLNALEPDDFSKSFILQHSHGASAFPKSCRLE
jgi:hypothetical protein